MSNYGTPKKITTEINNGVSVFSLPYYVARDQGYFGGVGIEIESVSNSGNPALEITLVEDHHLMSSAGSQLLFEQGEMRTPF